MTDQKLQVIPLGGLGEFGMNMLVLRTGDDMILIDAGMMFPEVELLGVDIVIPDITYLKQNRQHLRAILLMEYRVIHRGKYVHPLQRRRESVIKFPLRFQTNDPVPSRGQHERRHVDRAGIREQAPCGVVEIELGHHALPMLLDGLDADGELGRDLLVGVTLRDQPENLGLP